MCGWDAALICQQHCVFTWSCLTVMFLQNLSVFIHRDRSLLVGLFANRKWDILLQVQILSEPNLMLCLNTFLSSFLFPLFFVLLFLIVWQCLFSFDTSYLFIYIILLNSCMPSLIHEWFYDRREIVRAAPSPCCIWSNLLCRSFARLPKGARSCVTVAFKEISAKTNERIAEFSSRRGYLCS